MKKRIGTNPRAKKVVDTILSPVEDFLKLEAAGGILLMITTIIALIWANSPYYQSYEHFIHLPIGLKLGPMFVEKTLHHWVNDGLMVIFFFVVGLEIKREMVVGELSSPKKAALPMFAAIGGMVVPALIYTMINYGDVGQHGWGIPMATDIAFAVGLLTLFSKRAPFALKIFLLALAIVDDLGAVLVIAFFYTDEISRYALMFAGGFIGLIYIMRIAGIRQPLPYLIVSLFVWAGILKSGVHATIAGVIIGLLTPIEPLYPLKEVSRKFKELLGFLSDESEKIRSTDTSLSHEAEKRLEEMHHYVFEAKSPLERSIHALHPWVTYVIMPVFALVNAGVRIEGVNFSGFISNPISLGIIGGLFIGKPLGVLVASYAAVKLKIAELPQGVTWRHLFAVGCLAGVGFTMALFISLLALKSPELEVYSKLGILAASVLSGAAGIILLNSSKPIEKNQA